MKERFAVANPAFLPEEEDDSIARIASSYAARRDGALGEGSGLMDLLRAASPSDHDAGPGASAPSDAIARMESRQEHLDARLEPLGEFSSMEPSGNSAGHTAAPWGPAPEPDGAESAGAGPVSEPGPPDASLEADNFMPTPPAAGVTTSGAAPVADAPLPSSGGGFIADEMGWGAEAFASAGGYDAVMSGQFPCGAFAGDGSDIFLFIENLDLDVTNNTFVQETNVNLIADNGGILDIDGDVIISQTQEAMVVEASAMAASPPAAPSDMSYDNAVFDMPDAMA